MLESVTLQGGTGTRAAVAGYRVAGKTGTAQQPDPKTGKYSDSVYWDTFAGMAPADNPRFVVSIMIDNPAHGLEGGDVAAPLFHHIAAYELSARPDPAVRIGLGAGPAHPELATMVDTRDQSGSYAGRADGRLARYRGQPWPPRRSHPDGRRRPAAGPSLPAIAGRAVRRSGSVRPGDPAAPSAASPQQFAVVRPGDLFAALPGAPGTVPGSSPARSAAGAVAVLTDPAAPPAARRRVPVIEVDDPRAVLGPVAARVYGDPAQTACRYSASPAPAARPPPPSWSGPACGRPASSPAWSARSASFIGRTC